MQNMNARRNIACCLQHLFSASASLPAPLRPWQLLLQPLTTRHHRRRHFRPADEPVSKASYIVQQGDCLGKILREVFKLPDAVIFSPQTKLTIQKANPHIHNLNALQAGEKLFVPAGDSAASPGRALALMRRNNQCPLSRNGPAITCLIARKKTRPQASAAAGYTRQPTER